MEQCTAYCSSVQKYRRGPLTYFNQLHRAVSLRAYDELRTSFIKRHTVEESHEQALLTLEKMKLLQNTDQDLYCDESMTLMDKAEGLA